MEFLERLVKNENAISNLYDLGLSLLSFFTFWFLGAMAFYFIEVCRIKCLASSDKDGRSCDIVFHINTGLVVRHIIVLLLRLLPHSRLRCVWECAAWVRLAQFRIS